MYINTFKFNIMISFFITYILHVNIYFCIIIQIHESLIGGKYVLCAKCIINCSLI